MVKRRSICTVRNISCSLRLHVFCDERNRFRAAASSRSTSPAPGYANAGPSVRRLHRPRQVDPPVALKMLVFDRQDGVLRFGGMSVYGTTTRRSSANDPISRPFTSSKLGRPYSAGTWPGLPSAAGRSNTPPPARPSRRTAPTSPAAPGTSAAPQSCGSGNPAPSASPAATNAAHAHASPRRRRPQEPRPVLPAPAVRSLQTVFTAISP